MYIYIIDKWITLTVSIDVLSMEKITMEFNGDKQLFVYPYS